MTNYSPLSAGSRMPDHRRRIMHVVGARPNFMKVAPVMRALADHDHLVQLLVHTGQHYDANMSGVFFEQLGLPEPDVNLDVRSGTHAQQTACIMQRLEPVVMEHKPDLVLVYGDVNSTVSTALVCAKLRIRVGHVEAGLRSFDRAMPEEINRILTDRIADLLFTPSSDGDENLLKEGVAPDRIHRVGNVMIDSLIRFLPLAADLPSPVSPLPSPYALVTLHRPSNVDAAATLGPIMEALCDISRQIPVIFPVHPRTRQRIAELEGGRGWDSSGGECAGCAESDPKTDPGRQGGRPRTPRTLTPGIRLTDPVGYLEFLALERQARLVITDSGGIQEETTFLGIPCLTVRENTERPVTVTLGTNVLVGRDMNRLRHEVGRALAGDAKQGQKPPLWDGRAAERIAEVVDEEIGS